MEKEKTDQQAIQYAAKEPYPAIEVTQPNSTYAKIMLDNMAGQSSEMTAVSSYFYNNLVALEEEVRTTFHKISMVEMHHLQIFGDLALQLGENPRLWVQRQRSRIYWSPEYVHYPDSLSDLLDTALAAEQQTVANYRRQAEYIDDEYIQKMLRRIIKDETIHIGIFEQLIEKYCR